MRKADLALLGIFVIAWAAVWSLWPIQRLEAQNVSPGIPMTCVVTVSTATTIQALTAGGCATELRERTSALYITDLLFSASATGIAADAFPTLKYGTGTTCGTGTSIIWGALSAAAFVVPQQFRTALRVPPANDLCWISSTAGSKFIVLSGYYAP